MQDWTTIVNCSPKCIDYRIIKSNFDLENYLLSLHRDLGIAFAKIKTCNLPVETGRWENIDKYLRICTLCGCNSTCIGDKFHYVMECTILVMIEKISYSRDIVKTPTLLCELMNSNDLEISKQLSKFLKIIIKAIDVCSS